VKFGVHVPQWGVGATRESVLSVARTIEDAGLDSLWVGDHIVYPRRGDAPYPYRREGPPFEPGDGFLEALTTLAVIAGNTDRVLLGTSVLVASMREPLLLAKTVASLDVLSGGRVILGVGAGWWREEFAALRVGFRDRYSRLDETIEILRVMWREGSGSYSGKHFHFDDVVCLPKPTSIGRPAIWIGGLGPKALERAAKYGDGWHAVGGNPERIAAGRDEIEKLARGFGRDPSGISLSTATGLKSDPEQMLQRIRGLAVIGVTHIVMSAFSQAADDLCQLIEGFATEVLPTLRQELPSNASGRRGRGCK
jgi:probable F420-dependent oxidoreductase